MVLSLKNKTVIFWFRQDLRLSDNPGLVEASKSGRVLPVFIYDPRFQIGAASKWWLHHSLNRLNESLNGNLNIYYGDSLQVLKKISKEYPVSEIYWNRLYEPLRIEQDTIIKSHFNSHGTKSISFNGSLLWEPWETLKKDQTPYKVFTPFYKNAALKSPRFPVEAPDLNFAQKNSFMAVDELKLLPEIPWYKGMESWGIGEKAAHEVLKVFLDEGMADYKQGRNYPAQKKVSRLSPYLHFGEISPNQVWHAASFRKDLGENLDTFLTELGWREFAHSLLYYFPKFDRENFQEKFNDFPWGDNAQYLSAWQNGKTGYPIVDAGMRELWSTGYMHNRVRMIVGSFLVKNLLIHWHHGKDWFWDCLVDADLANNSAGWQWIAGCGADAAPYFRIFNPILQGEKFDPDGEYIRKFLPELSKLPLKYLFTPWEAPDYILKSADIKLGQNYPLPIVDFNASRKQALSAYASVKII